MTTLRGGRFDFLWARGHKSAPFRRVGRGGGSRLPLIDEFDSDWASAQRRSRAAERRSRPAMAAQGKAGKRGGGGWTGRGWPLLVLAVPGLRRLQSSPLPGGEHAPAPAGCGQTLSPSPPGGPPNQRTGAPGRFSRGRHGRRGHGTAQPRRPQGLHLADGRRASHVTGSRWLIRPGVRAFGHGSAPGRTAGDDTQGGRSLDIADRESVAKPGISGVRPPPRFGGADSSGGTGGYCWNMGRPVTVAPVRLVPWSTRVGCGHPVGRRGGKAVPAGSQVVLFFVCAQSRTLGGEPAAIKIPGRRRCTSAPS